MQTDKKPASYYDTDRAEMLRYIDRKAIHVLDVGCGPGHFGVVLKEQRQATVVGIEIDETIAREASPRLDHVYCGDALEIIRGLEDDSFDLICFNDSLEHMVWPEEVLKSCLPKLRPDGQILCSLPNLRYFRVMFNLLFGKKFEYSDAGILDRTHLRFFTIDSISQMFSRCGYELVLLEGNQAHAAKRTRSWRYRIFQLITLGRAEDMRHGQFHILAKVKNNS